MQTVTTAVAADLARVWAGLDEQVAAGSLPGYVAGVRHAGVTEVRAGGALALGGPGAEAPMHAGTPFRIASLSKPFAGALALSLVEDATIALGDPVSRWLPELAEPRVLRVRTGPLADTVPAARPITVEHLLRNTAGFGGVWEPCPLAVAMAERGVAPGPLAPAMDPEEYLRRLAGLPLAEQPGAGWLYHTSADVLSVLLARAAGAPLDRVLAERVTGPLGLGSTGFHAVDPSALPRCYQRADGGLAPYEMPAGAFTTPPAFCSLATGLVSTAPDVLTFLGAVADGGGPVLTPASVAAMTADGLSASSRKQAGQFLGPGRSWGLQVGVDPGGRWGWDGGTGTSGWVEPADDLVGVLLTQRMMSGPHDGPDAFWHALRDGVRGTGGAGDAGAGPA